MDRIMAKEIILKSSFRFAREYPVAVGLLAGGRLDVAPVLSHEFAVEDAVEALRTASDRRRSMKVHLRFCRRWRIRLPARQPGGAAGRARVGPHREHSVVAEAYKK